MPQPAVREVAAAVVQDQDKIWLIKYDDEPSWPWQLVNCRHDRRDPVVAIRQTLRDSYAVEVISTKVLGAETVRDQPTRQPKLVVTGIWATLMPGQVPKPMQGITLKTVTSLELDDYNLPRVYRKFADSVFDYQPPKDSYYLYDRGGLWLYAVRPKNPKNWGDNTYTVMHSHIPAKFGQFAVTQLSPNWFMAQPQGQELLDLSRSYLVPSGSGYLIWVSISELGDILSRSSYDQVIDYDNLWRFDDWLQKHHPAQWRQLH